MTPEVWGTAGPHERLPGAGGHETRRLLFQTCGPLQSGTHPSEPQFVGPPGGRGCCGPSPPGGVLTHVACGGLGRQTGAGGQERGRGDAGGGGVIQEGARGSDGWGVRQGAGGSGKGTDALGSRGS